MTRSSIFTRNETKLMLEQKKGLRFYFYFYKRIAWKDLSEDGMGRRSWGYGERMELGDGDDRKRNCMFPIGF
uniref:Uncharacterized protein n=1 Tax=Anguilla anguilla TaxID=7936 RepID=A0A0E9RB27_ANGAN